MGRMIAHSKDVHNHGGNPRCGPDIAAKAEGFGPFGQFVGHLRQLLFGQLWSCSRWGLMSQGLHPQRSHLFEPLAHRPLAHAKRFGDVFLVPSSFMQFPCLHASGFTPVCWRCAFCAHTSFYRLISPTLYFSLLRSITCSTEYQNTGKLRSDEQR